MEEIITKYNRLDNISKLYVLKFIDFLNNENQRKNFDLEAYKKKILNVGVWTDEDIAILEENNKGFKNWKVYKW